MSQAETASTEMSMNPTRDDFAAMFEESIAESGTGEGRVVKGMVIAIEKDQAIIDVGLKTEGRVPLKEFTPPGRDPTLAVGDEVEVYLERVENAIGEALLSRDKARREESWNKLEKAYDKSERVTGAIVGRVKGGFTVDLDGANAFLPGSQVDIRPVRDIQPLMNMEQPFQILKMDRRRGNIVVSRRAVLEEDRAEQRQELVQNLAEGQIIEGVVKNITDYGAFVDLGGVDGLLARHGHGLAPGQSPNRGPADRRDRESPGDQGQSRDPAHLAGHEATSVGSVGGRRPQISGWRALYRTGHEHHRLWCLR